MELHDNLSNESVNPENSGAFRILTPSLSILTDQIQPRSFRRRFDDLLSFLKNTEETTAKDNHQYIFEVEYVNVDLNDAIFTLLLATIKENSADSFVSHNLNRRNSHTVQPVIIPH